MNLNYPNWWKILEPTSQLALKKLEDPILQKKKNKWYLNDGSGSPWAGQVIAKLWPDDFLNADESTIDENLGLLNPIGSMEK